MVQLLSGGSRPVASGTGPPDGGEFTDFYAAYYQPLTIQLYAYTANLSVAQDVVQEAFCRALARWPKVSTLDNPVAWVRRVAWNLATSHWRRSRTAALFVRAQRTEHVAEPSTDRVALAHALAALPEQQRRAVILHYLADLSVSEIAAQEGAAEGTVKSWLHRGRTALAAQLGGTDRSSGKENVRG